jgi:uncharacterized protein YjiS (DUF1127 family)
MPAITALAISTFAPAGRALMVLGSHVKRGFWRFSSLMRHRRDAMRLARLDDHMLADIGLTRSDLRDAYSEPLWHDPTDVLARRAADRRMSRQLVAPDSARVVNASPARTPVPKPWSYQPDNWRARCSM